jgi:hypothetical protein
MKSISIRQLKRDIKVHELYEVYEGKYGKHYDLIMLNEDNNIYINIVNIKYQLQGFSRIDKNELLSFNKKDLFRWINEVIFYCCNEPIEID